MNGRLLLITELPVFEMHQFRALTHLQRENKLNESINRIFNIFHCHLIP